MAFYLDDGSPDGATTEPTRPAAGARRYFRDENLALGQQGTEVPAWVLNMVVNEIVAAVAAAGLTPSKTDDTQLATAISTIVGQARPRVPVVAKAANYTAVWSDIGSVLAFTPGAATLSLSTAATLGNGWWCWVRNAASSGDVVVDPFGSETLDGMASRTVAPGTQVLIACNGTGFITLCGRYTWTSGDLAITAASGGSLSHPLGVTPEVSAMLRCVSDDLGYVAGDFLETNLAGSSASNGGMAIAPAPTVIRYRIGTGGLYGTHISTGAVAALTAASWRLIIRASVRYG